MRNIKSKSMLKNILLKYFEIFYEKTYWCFYKIIAGGGKPKANSKIQDPSRPLTFGNNTYNTELHRNYCLNDSGNFEKKLKLPH